MKKRNMGAASTRGRIAMVGAAAAVTLALGAGITNALGERVILNVDGQTVEQGQADVNGQDGIEVVDATTEGGEGKTPEAGLVEPDAQKDDAGDTAAEGDAAANGDAADEGKQGIDGEQQTEDSDAPKGPKVAPQLEVRGPKVGGDPNAKYPSIDAPKVVINDPKRDYIDEKGKPATSPVGCKDLSGSKTGWLPLKSGWYCFTKDAKLEGRGSIEGDVKIILIDGVKANWWGGLHMCAGSKLTIYGQKEGTGELEAEGVNRRNEAGIGGNQGESNTEVNICGGRVYARGGANAAGIGGGGSRTDFHFSIEKPVENVVGNGGEINIYGGTVKAIGFEGGAAIGGGHYGAGGTINILGGDVTAECSKTGIDHGAGIGGGERGSGGIIRIQGGKVKAVGHEYSAGIGGGFHKGVDQLTIEHATVTAEADQGAAIGSGRYDDGTSSVSICDAKVTATSKDGAGIGAGENAEPFPIEIEGDCVVDAKSETAAAIGRGNSKTKVSSLRLSDGLRVISCDDNNKKVPAAERVSYCLYRNHVKIESCDHAACHYEKDDKTHKKVCDYCMTSQGETEAHHWASSGHCQDCGFKRNMPSFSDVRWRLGDALGLTFCVEGPFDEDPERFDDAYMELYVRGKNPRLFRIANSDAAVDQHGRRCFTIALSVVEAGQPVGAVYHFDGDQKISIMRSFDSVLADAASGEKAQEKIACIRMAGNYTHYVQELLSKANGWEFGCGDDDRHYASFHAYNMLDVEGAKAALVQHKAKVKKKGTDIEAVSASLTYGSTVTMSISLKAKPGAQVDAKVEFDGDEIRFERGADGLWRARIEGISLTELDKLASVSGTCGGAFSAEISPLSYINAVMQSKKSDDTDRAAMAAVYHYFEKVGAYREQNAMDRDVLLVSADAAK